MAQFKVTESNGSGVLAWAQKVEQLNAELSLPLLLLHIQKVTHFFLPSPLPDTSLCLERGVGFLSKNYVLSLTLLLKRFPLDRCWMVLEAGIRPPKKGSRSTAGLLVSLSKWVIHEHAHAHTNAQTCLNKHCKLAARERRLFSIWIVARYKKAQNVYLGWILLRLN